MYKIVYGYLLIASLCFGGEGKWTTYGPYGISFSEISYSHSWGTVITPTICAGSDNQGVYFFNFDKKEWVSHNEGLTDLRIISVAPMRVPIDYMVWPNGFWVSTKDSGIFVGGFIWRWKPYHTELASPRISLLSSGSLKIGTERPAASLYAVVNDTEIFVRHYIDTSELTSWQRTEWVGLKCTAIHTLEGFPNILYVGAIKEDGETSLWKTSDWGKNWKKILNIKTGEITSIDYLSGGAIYVATDSGTVYISWDGGKTWNSSFLPIHTSILSLVVASSGVIYVGTRDRGVYQSSDSGKTWKEMNDGLTPKTVNSLDIVKNTLYAGTSDGVWEYTIKEGITEKTELLRDVKMDISPNPFKTVVSVKWWVVGKGPINLEVYDASGRLIRNLAKVQSPEHRAYTIIWDGRDENGELLPAGVYFIELKTENYLLTRKVILMRR